MRRHAKFQATVYAANGVSWAHSLFASNLCCVPVAVPEGLVVVLQTSLPILRQMSGVLKPVRFPMRFPMRCHSSLQLHDPISVLVVTGRIVAVTDAF